MGMQMSKLNCECLCPAEKKEAVEIVSNSLYKLFQDKLVNSHNHLCKGDQTGIIEKSSYIDSYYKNDLSQIKSEEKFVKLENLTMRDLVSIPNFECENNDKIIISKCYYIFELDTLTNNPEENKKLSLSIDEGKKICTQSSRHTLFTKQFTTSFRSNQTDAASSLSIRGNFLLNECDARYYGPIVNNQKEGVGTVVWSNGSKFIGLFIHNRAYGIGKYNDSNGAIFVGEYDNNKPSGWGYFTHLEGFIYEGTWVGRRQENIGFEIWPDSTIYQGEYYRGKKQGIGIYKWPDGTIYEGEWNDNAITGYGILYFKDDRIYMGEFSIGLMHGYGEFYWPDGKKYIGFYQHNEKYGFGIFIWSLKPYKAYVGFWHNGEQHGVGLTMNDSNVSYGYWSKGKKEITFKNIWEMKKYAKEKTKKYNVIFEKNPREILNLV